MAVKLLPPADRSPRNHVFSLNRFSFTKLFRYDVFNATSRMILLKRFRFNCSETSPSSGPSSAKPHVFLDRFSLTKPFCRGFFNSTPRTILSERFRFNCSETSPMDRSARNHTISLDRFWFTKLFVVVSSWG